MYVFILAHMFQHEFRFILITHDFRGANITLFDVFFSLFGLSIHHFR